MKSSFKLLLIVFFITTLASNAAVSKRGLDAYEWGKIDATKNARLHSNMGNIYFDEKNYAAALKEYEIAYNLSYGSSGSSTYLYNIARCFMKLQNYALAKNAIIGAIEKDCINMTYYETFVDCCIKLGIAEKELNKALKENENPYNRIIAGLIYLKTNRKAAAKAIFDEFIVENPKMIITEDVRAMLSRMN